MSTALAMEFDQPPVHIRRNRVAEIAGDDRYLFFDDGLAQELGFGSALQVRAVRDQRMNMTRLQEASLAAFLRVSVTELYEEGGAHVG